MVVSVLDMQIFSTFGRLTETYCWPGMQVDVEEFIHSCLTCQQGQAETRLPAGLSKPLPIRELQWGTLRVPGRDQILEYDATLAMKASPD